MALQTGATVGNYRIVCVLGSGGSGCVYRVEHTITGRVEAIKVLLETGQEKSEQAERFLREIQVQARLNHPNIAAVHNAFWADGHLLMVMEYVEGETLETRLARSRVPLTTAVAYMHQALSALSYAHERSVTHRDVKPGNLMICRDSETVKVMDFGLARGGSDLKLTQTGTVVGSLYYISPEQVKASADLDERADIYSLGVVFYELVTGQKPFRHEQAFDLMTAHVHEAPRPPAEIEPSLPGELNDAILRALSKEPRDRFQAAAEFLAVTGRFLDSFEQEAASTAPRPARSVPELHSTSASAVISQSGGEPGSGPSATAPKPSPSSFLGSPWSRRAAAATAAVLLILTASFLVPWRKPPQESQVAAVSTGDFELVSKLGLGSDLETAAFSPDGHWLATGAADHSITIWNALTGQEDTSLSGHTAAVTSLAFSPENDRLASASRDGTAKIWSLETQRPLVTLLHSTEVLSVAFSPSGERLATGTTANTVHLWNAADGQAIRALPAREKPLLLKFSPSGEQLVSSDRQTSLRMWNLNENTDRSELFAVDQPIVAVRFHPDGQSLAVASATGFQEWNLSSMRQIRGVSNLSGVTALAFTPKGHVITLAANRDRVTVQDMTASEEIGRLQHGAAVQAAELSLDGMESYTYTDGGGLWLWRGRPELVALHAAPAPEPDAAGVATNTTSPGERGREASGRRKGIFRRLIGVFRK
jgi:serine/threonine protein kinase